MSDDSQIEMLTELEKFYDAAFKAGEKSEREKFCALLRTLHDSLSCPPDSNNVKPLS